MKYLSIAILVALFFVPPGHAAKEGKHLFILSGQSNMNGLDPDISFTPTVEAEFGKENVIVVKDAQGGQPLRRWYKQWKCVTDEEPQAIGDLYDRLMGLVNTAINEKKIATVTLVWMQGERDAKEQHGDVYAAGLEGLIRQLAEDMERKDVNFVIGRLSDFGLYKNTLKEHWEMVRSAQVAVAESSSRGAWVDSDDLNSGVNKKGKPIENDLHLSVEGYRVLGRRFADKAIQLIRENAELNMAEYAETPHY